MSEQVVRLDPRALVAAYIGGHPDVARRFKPMSAEWLAHDPTIGHYDGPDALRFYDVLKMAEDERGLTWHLDIAPCVPDFPVEQCSGRPCETCAQGVQKQYYTRQVPDGE